MAIGGFLQRRLWAILAAGALVGSMLAALVSITGASHLARPSRLQISSLIVAIAFEIAGIAWVNSHLRSRGRRTLLLATLLVVGVHFFLMVPAFGPLIGLLGAFSVLNAAVGLSVASKAPWQVFWVIDGALKLAVGGLMLVLAPRLW
jgi:Family of unknown function (DUF6609)